MGHLLKFYLLLLRTLLLYGISLNFTPIILNFINHIFTQMANITVAMAPVAIKVEDIAGYMYFERLGFFIEWSFMELSIFNLSISSSLIQSTLLARLAVYEIEWGA